MTEIRLRSMDDLMRLARPIRNREQPCTCLKAANACSEYEDEFQQQRQNLRDVEQDLADLAARADDLRSSRIEDIATAAVEIVAALSPALGAVRALRAVSRLYLLTSGELFEFLAAATALGDAARHIVNVYNINQELSLILGRAEDLEYEMARKHSEIEILQHQFVEDCVGLRPSAFGDEEDWVIGTHWRRHD
jgi:hypothetical protein